MDGDKNWHAACAGLRYTEGHIRPFHKRVTSTSRSALGLSIYRKPTNT